MAEKVLAGIKVVEWSSYIAGPTTARLLGDWGADVIKIESYYGDTLRPLGMNMMSPTDDDENPVFFNANANKRVLAINIKTEAGIKIMHELIADADVFVTSLRKDALQRAGFDYETLKEKYPRLIFAHVLGYGEDGPIKDRPAFDFSTYFARSGFMSVIPDSNGPPSVNAPAVGDNQLALALAAGINLALYKREKTGKGDYVNVSLYHMGIYTFNLLHSADHYEHTYPQTHDEPLSPLVTVYKCSDGEWFYISSPDYITYFPKACKVLGLDALADDEEYNDLFGMLTHKIEIKAMFQEQFLKKTSKEWCALFEEANIPAERVFTLQDSREDEQAWANDFFVEVQYKNGNKGPLATSPVRLRSMGHGFDFEKLPGGIGAEAVDVLTELGYSEADMEKLKEAKAVNFGE